MYIVKLLRFLRGYVKFLARSGPVERFVNLCAHHHIPLWECMKTEGRFTGYTTARGYRRMHRLARKAGVTTKVTERKGLPFLIHRYRKRIGIAIGVAVFVVVLAASQQFIWVVKVEGCERVSEQQVLNVLYELGVKRAALKNSVDPKEIPQKVLFKISDLSWATLNIQGTTATLLVRERTLPPEKIDTNVPANVVAAQDGVIRKLEVTDGKAVVKVGDTVLAGDIIVSGVNEDRWGLTHLVRANATVIAHVPQTLTVEVPLQQEEVHLTGKVVKRRYLDIFGVHLPLFIYSGLEGDYKMESLTRSPEIFGLTMPFEITRESYVFYEKNSQTISQESALHIAQRELETQERKTWGEAILSREVHADVENGVLVLTGEYMVETDIAKQVEIPVFDRNEIAKGKQLREGGY